MNKLTKSDVRSAMLRSMWDVMQNSRSVVRLYYHTEQEKLLKY